MDRTRVRRTLRGVAVGLTLFAAFIAMQLWLDPEGLAEFLWMSLGFYSCVGASIAGTAVISYLYQRATRIPEGADPCPGCGFDLRGSAGDCPECGTIRSARR